MMKGRIAIPIHNERGEWVGYCGRWPGDDGWPEVEDKYKLPGGFLKSHLVFNLNRVGESVRERGLILVEGFFSCFWLHQCGFPNVVALMGSFLSEQQRELLVAAVGPQGRITVLLDNDEAGRNGEAQCLEELCQYIFVKVTRLPAGHNQPDNLTTTQAHQLLG